MDPVEKKLAKLYKKFGEDADLLSPEQIAPHIRKTEGVQANMRHFKTFPIPVISVGRNVFVSIDDLAEYLATGKCEGFEPEGLQEDSTTPTKAERKRKPKINREFDDCLGYYTEWRNSINFQIQLLDEIERLELQESIPDFPDNDKRPLPT